MSERKLIAPLDLADFDPSVFSSNPGFTDMVNQELGNAATPDDGFEPVFEELVGIVDSLDTGLALLGGADGGTLDDTFEEILTLDDGPPHDNLVAATGDIPVGDAITADLGTLLGDATGAGTPPSSSGGTCDVWTGESTAPCGTHGRSSLSLDDDTGDCFAANALPVVRIRDGGCTFSYLLDGGDFPGKTTVNATSLRQGDARLFAISHDVAKRKADAACASRVSVKVAPYKTGHFLAKFNVKTTRNPGGEIWCLIVDVIP